MDKKCYRIRPFAEGDRAAVESLGQPVLDWWNAECACLHLVAQDAGGEVVAHLQIADRSFPKPSRRDGECQLRLTVASAHRGCGIGSGLYKQAEAFARAHGARRVTAAYTETTEGTPAAAFLAHRGFVPFESYHPSHLDLTEFDPGCFSGALTRVAGQGIRLLTYANVGDSPEHRRRLFELECAARSAQPFRDVGEYVPPRFEEWEEGLARRNLDTIFLAAAPAGRWVGVITSLEWGFTGVHPEWQSRGIATALKVHALATAKALGIARIETENHGDNHAMLAVNHKLGFVPGPVEQNCARTL
jgi:GNAT superfamily N-acetyltransferase